jgi:hypothetical protein
MILCSVHSGVRAPDGCDIYCAHYQRIEKGGINVKKLWLVLFFVATLVMFGSANSTASSGGSDTNLTGELNSLVTNRVNVGDSSMSASAADVEGVIMDSQQAARLKPGYTFRRESRSSVSVWKTMREAALQMGTLTCTRPRKGACTAEFDGDRAKCSSACYFVSVRGGVRAQ